MCVTLIYDMCVSNHVCMCAGDVSVPLYILYFYLTVIKYVKGPRYLSHLAVGMQRALWRY